MTLLLFPWETSFILYITTLFTLRPVLLPHLIGWSHLLRGHWEDHKAGWQKNRRSPAQGQCWVYDSQLRSPWAEPVYCCQPGDLDSAGQLPQFLQYNTNKPWDWRFSFSVFGKVQDEEIHIDVFTGETIYLKFVVWSDMSAAFVQIWVQWKRPKKILHYEHHFCRHDSELR